MNSTNKVKRKCIITKVYDVLTKSDTKTFRKGILFLKGEIKLMDKIGHLVVTKSLTGNMHKTHKAALLLGSILPDLFVYTYLEGHTWEATFDKIINHMEVLEEKGRGGCFSYLKLGWVLHYVEDYFTYPHNTIFEGTIPEHYAYEKKMTRWMRDGALEQMSMPICKKLDSSSQLKNRIQELHDNYLSQEM